MTVSYTLKVANAKFGGFSKLLFRWKGSIYKLLYREFMVFCLLYSFISVIYRYWDISKHSNNPHFTIIDHLEVFFYLFKANSMWAIVQHKCNSSIHVASYRCVLNNEQQEMFERLARHCNKFAKLIPMSFVLGEHKCSDRSNMILLTPWIPYKLNWSVVLVRVLCHTGVSTLVGSIYKLSPAR